jgi:GNAT superfamily N-acetyltransferase
MRLVGQIELPDLSGTNLYKLPAKPVIRSLWPYEQPRLREHLLRLDAKTRAHRFGYVASDERLAAYCGDTEWLRGGVVGAFIDGTLRGVAELRRYGAGWSSEAEAAFSVELEHQGRGIGRLLARHLTLLARNRGISRLHVITSTGNVRMRRILARLGATKTIAGDEIEAVMSLPPPTGLTYAEEWAAQSWVVAVTLAPGWNGPRRAA